MSALDPRVVPEAAMKPTAIQVHKSWLISAVLVLTLTVLAVGVVGWLAAKPFPWIVLIAGSLPLSMLIFVALPLLRRAGREG
jgi:peptidoglycan/LPS O-acetylase OafA/YrhL